MDHPLGVQEQWVWETLIPYDQYNNEPFGEKSWPLVSRVNKNNQS